MAPVAKKKNANRRNTDSLPDKKGFTPNIDPKTTGVQQLPSKSNEAVNEPNDIQDKKYSKRTVTSNWEKYEEVPHDPHADTMRGKDLKVLLSYTSGSGCQLQLQDEKEWEETSVDEKSIGLDLKDLIHVVKSIPFHKQIKVPADVFSEHQLSKFESSAESWKTTYNPKVESSVEKKAVDKTIKEPETLDSQLNIIDNYELEEVEVAAPSKSVLLEEKTENIIESLASCLSLKASIAKVDEDRAGPKKENQSSHDDLDFLLSLNVSLKNPVQEESQCESKKTNVDDWLNSILDD